MPEKRLAAAAIAAALAAAAAGAHAQPAELHLSLHYDGRLLVKVFDMQVEQRASAGEHSSTARFQSSGILSAFKRFDERASSGGRVAGGDAMPGTFRTRDFASKKQRAVTVTWGRDDVAVSASPPYGPSTNPQATRQQKLEAADPLTQLMRMTLNGSRTGLCSRTVLFFDGRQLYNLHFSNARPVAPAEREQRLGLINEVRCDVRFEELAGFKPKPPSERDQGLKHGIMLDIAQVGVGGPWVLTALRASTPLGRGVIELTSVNVTGRDPTEVPAGR